MAPTSSLAELLTSTVRDVPDFPEPGVVFKDLGPLFADPAAFGRVAEALADPHAGAVDLVAGIEARGFVVGVAVARVLGVGFVPVRKAGKLPGETVTATYDLEYGSATLELQRDAVPAGSSVLLIDDVLATGGTAAAACELLEGVGARVRGVGCVVELGFLDGRFRLRDRTVTSLLTVS